MKYRLLLLNMLVPALLCACSAARAGDLGSLPNGWYVTGTDVTTKASPQNYTVGVDPAVLYDGRHSAYIGSKDSATVESFGAFGQTFSSKNYLGKRVKFSAAVKTKNATYVGLWVRVDGTLGSLRFDNMANRRIIGTTDWKTYDVVVDVPANATTITIGMLDHAAGEAWMSDATFTAVDTSVPTTDTIGPYGLSDQPRNLRF